VQRSDDAPLCPSEALVMPGRFSTGLPSWCPLAIVRLPREKKCPSLNLFTLPGYALAQSVPSARAAWPFPLLRQHWEQPPPLSKRICARGSSISCHCTTFQPAWKPWRPVCTKTRQRSTAAPPRTAGG